MRKGMEPITSCDWLHAALAAENHEMTEVLGLQMPILQRRTASKHRKCGKGLLKSIRKDLYDMRSDLWGRFHRRDSNEILRKRIERDRFIPVFAAMLFIEAATSVVFPCIDLYNALQKTDVSLRAAMHPSLGYAFLCSTVAGAVVIPMAVSRLVRMEKNVALKGRRLCTAGLYSTVGLIVVLLGAWIIV